MRANKKQLKRLSNINFWSIKQAAAAAVQTLLMHSSVSEQANQVRSI